MTGRTINLSPQVGVDVHTMAEVAGRVATGAHIPNGRELDQLISAGELLPGWYDTWIVIERERIRQLRLIALENAAECLMQAGRYGEAVAAARAAVGDEPLRESAHLALVRAHLAGGNRFDAIRQYQFHAKVMKRELGLEPSPAIEQLTRPLRR